MVLAISNILEYLELQKSDIPSGQSREDDNSSAANNAIEVLCQVEGVIVHQLVVDGGASEPLNVVGVGESERDWMGFVREEIWPEWNLKKLQMQFFSLQSEGLQCSMLFLSNLCPIDKLTFDKFVFEELV